MLMSHGRYHFPSSAGSLADSPGVSNSFSCSKKTFPYPLPYRASSEAPRRCSYFLGKTYIRCANVHFSSRARGSRRSVHRVTPREPPDTANIVVWAPWSTQTLQIQWFGRLEAPKPYKYNCLDASKLPNLIKTRKIKYFNHFTLKTHRIRPCILWAG